MTAAPSRRAGALAALIDALGRPGFATLLAGHVRDEVGAAGAVLARVGAGARAILAGLGDPSGGTPPAPCADLAPGSEPWCDAAAGRAHALLLRERGGGVVLTLAASAADGETLRAALAARLPLLRGLWRAHLRARGLEGERNALFEALAQRGLGAVALDGGLGPLSANRRAVALMRDSGALSLDARRLRAAAPADAARLGSAVAALRAEAARGRRAPLGLALDGSGSGRMLRLQLCAVGLADDAEGARLPALVALLEDPTRDLTPEIRDNARRHGLTAVETELACRLADGRTIDQAAQEQRISVHTARKYLQQIFAKTQTSRQADLVRLLVSGTIPQGAAGLAGLRLGGARA